MIFNGSFISIQGGSLIFLLHNFTEKNPLFPETLFAARTFDAAADLKTCFVVTLVKKDSNNNQVKPFPRPVVVCKPQVQSKEKVRITTHEKARER